MIGAITNHLWQSTWFAAAVTLLALAFRGNRAQVRYSLWLSASLKFLVPFALLTSLGAHLGWAPTARGATTRLGAPTVGLTMSQMAQPFADFTGAAPPAPGSRDWLPAAILTVWACGFFSVALVRLRGWQRVRTALRASMPMDVSTAVEVRAAPGLLEPGVVGLWRSVLLVPAGIANHLTPAQLEAVLAHELCHVRRRDNLLAAIHMVVEAAFWFHPLVWWIGARLVEERERACDEEVLRLGSQPQVYAEGILRVCRSYLESPLRCVSGVTGSDLKRRIQTILTAPSARDLTLARKAALAAAAFAALAAPVGVGMLGASPGRAQTASVPPPAVSIRPCGSGEVPRRGRGGSGEINVIPVTVDAKGDFQIPNPPPGHLRANCATLADLIQTAYVVFADGQYSVSADRARSTQIDGGPAWVESDRYRIAGAAPVSPDATIGPLLQAMLQDRFRLKIHRETRTVPVYNLTVAAGGLKLAPFPEGSCVPIHFPRFFESIARVKYAGIAFEPTFSPGVHYCPNRVDGEEPNAIVEAQGASIDDFSSVFLSGLDRPVINQTGIPGLFNFHLSFTPDRLTSALLEQLGLQLQPALGLRDVWVIDSVEKPAEN